MKNILIIEDDLNIRESISELLEVKFYKVRTAKNGEEGILLARQHHPDLIICDIMMPGKSGYDVLEEIRGHQDTADTPFIFLTAKSQKSDLRAGMNLGADDYLTKPFVASELFEAVEMRLKRREVSKAAIKEEVSVAKSLQNEAFTDEMISTLNGVLDASTLLAAEYDNYTKDEVLGFVRDIKSSSSYLKRKVRQVLVLKALDKMPLDAKLEKTLLDGKVQASDLKQILQDGATLKERRQDLFIDGIADESVISSSLFFNTVVDEVIDNALRYSPEGSLVRVSGYKDGKSYVVQVSNAASNHVAEIIDPSAETNSTSKRMGLHLTERVMKAVGGELLIEQEAGTATVSLKFKLS